MSTELTPLEPGQIRFHQASPPPIPPGDYTLTATQTLSGKDIRQVFETDAAFTVAGPRFYLKPTEVYSVYPPTGHFGPFDNALPHIVFTRRTLPWERSIDGQPQNPDAPAPWLALLLLSRDDFGGKLPKVEARTVAKLLNPEESIQGPNGLTLEGGQTAGDLCNTIDLPKEVFTEIVPSKEDLPFLAHVREVNTGGKETLSLKQDGWFTVVLGNRLPATVDTKDPRQGETNLVCLVSLEGFGELLPTVDDAGKATALDTGKTHIRLAVLASWNFTCHGNNDFKVKMRDLDDTSLLALPQAGLTTTDTGTVAVKNAFALGYSALNHTTRLGEKTVSWFRGPLIPLEMLPLSPYAFIPCADRVLRYDFNNGLFATEYAAAFELGRMMALQNRSFASAMYRFRNRVSQDMEAEWQQASLESALGLPAKLRGKPGDKDEKTGYQSFVRQGSLEDAVAKLFADSMPT